MTQGAETSGVWTENVRIHSHDVDFNQRATLEAICHDFLEAAWEHAEVLGVGYRFLAAQQKFWVLSRLLMKVEKYPRWGDCAVLKTWPRPPKSIFALRDFELLNSDGAQLLGGSSAWLVLDATSRRPQRLEKVIGAIRTFPDRMAIGEDPAKLTDDGAGQVQLTTAVRYSDLDVNSHVNSARYVRWLLDSYGLDFHRVHSIRRLEINYVSETLGGETISIHSQETAPLHFSHALMKSDGAEVCRARLEWRGI
jgi:acyl-ACP thioesterase